jgi:hypothetical protein
MFLRKHITQAYMQISIPYGKTRRRTAEGRGQKVLKICKEIGKMLGKMMNEPEKWCSRFRRL